jgi:hypothetical protein
VIDLSVFKGADALRCQFESGRPIILVARNSGSGGKAARGLAADEVVKAAEGLGRIAGIDITSALPSKSEIIAGLKNSKAIKSQTKNGKYFTNEYWILTLAAVNTILFVSTGSGKELDDQYEQPFVQELITLVKARTPALVFANRIDRIFRRMLTGAELLNVLSNLECSLGDSEKGIRDQGEWMDLMILMESMGAEKEASAVPKKTRDGMTANTDRKMENGCLKYASPSQPPAGLIRVILLNPKGGKGVGMLYLDDPAYYPDPSQVAYGLPSRTLDASRMSNVELVKWALSNLGKPGFTLASIGEQLAQSGFSSPGIRKENGVEATFQPTEITDRKYLPLRPIINNLKFYESGIFQVRYGVAEVSDIEITNCFPASGKWAEPEDFERIADYLSKTTGGGPASLGLIGVHVETEFGTSAFAAAMGDQCKRGAAYVLRPIDKKEGRLGFPALPHNVLARSIVEGLVRAAKKTWIPLEAQAHQVNPSLQVEIAKLRKSVERAARQASTFLEQMVETDASGAVLLDSDTRKAMGIQRGELVRTQLEPNQKRLQELEEQLFAEMEAKSGSSETAPVNLLHELVASLGDPSNTKYNKWWKSALSIQSMEKTSSMRDSHLVSVLAWKGLIRISALSRIFEIPFSGEYVTGSATSMEERIAKVISLMGEGVLFDEIHVPQLTSLKPAIARSLRIPSQTFNLASCPDPRLLRIGILVATNPILTDTDLGRQLDEPQLLVSRVREALVTQPYGSQWVRRGSHTKAAWFQTAAHNRGLVTQSDLLKMGPSHWIDALSGMRRSSLDKSVWNKVGIESAQLRPCDHCQSHRRSSSRLYEPTGLVCLDCHRDEAGLIWPSDPYDQWLDISLLSM